MEILERLTRVWAWCIVCRWKQKQAPQFWGSSLSFWLLTAQPHLVRRRRRRRLLLCLSEECRKEARRGKVEAKSQQEAVDWVDWTWLLGSLPPWGSKVSHLSPWDNNIVLHLDQLLGRLLFQNVKWNTGLTSVFCSAVWDEHCSQQGCRPILRCGHV